MSNRHLTVRPVSRRGLKFEGSVPPGTNILSAATYGTLIILACDDGIWIVDTEDNPPQLKKLHSKPFHDCRMN
jgi:hypothetical protein